MRGISCKKDHKEPEEDESFPTRLVIPATNVTATFSKLGYLGIKQILDDNKVDYSRFTIIQVSDLKEVGRFGSAKM
eukprot:8139175-Ditylum_brightwellii.AAC.1